MEADKRAMIVYNELREILEKMDITVDEPKHVTNPNKLGDIGIKCSNSEHEEEAWIIIKRNLNILELIPPTYKTEKRKHFTNESTNRDLCDLLNRIVREYVIDKKEILLDNDSKLISDMDDLISQYGILFKKSSKFKNIKIAKTSFHKDYIELNILCRNKDSLSNETKHTVDFWVPILLTKNNSVVDRRKENWVANEFKNRDDITMLVHKKTLKTFNRILKDTILKDIYSYKTNTKNKDIYQQKKDKKIKIKTINTK